MDDIGKHGTHNAISSRATLASTHDAMAVPFQLGRLHRLLLRPFLSHGSTAMDPTAVAPTRHPLGRVLTARMKESGDARATSRLCSTRGTSVPFICPSCRLYVPFRIGQDVSKSVGLHCFPRTSERNARLSTRAAQHKHTPSSK
jgi:hypothetical protein